MAPLAKTCILYVHAITLELQLQLLYNINVNACVVDVHLACVAGARWVDIWKNQLGIKHHELPLRDKTLMRRDRNAFTSPINALISLSQYVSRPLIEPR